jgi:hypothetical protein
MTASELETGPPKIGGPMSLADVRFCATTGRDTFLNYAYMRALPDRTICFYTNRVNKNEPNEEQKANLDRQGKEYNGNMSRATRSKVNKILLNWMAAVQTHLEEKNYRREKCEIYPVFVTLTLSDKQRHSDNWLKRHYLNPFIKRAKRNWGVENYFWRAEPQKNGNIHFHTILDRYIPKDELTAAWNEIQSEYVASYQQRTGKSNPPSTQVQKIRSYKRVSLYACKYALKGADWKTDSEGAPIRKIEGRIWGCSAALKAVKAHVIPVTSEERASIEAELRAVQHFPVEKWDADEGYLWLKLPPVVWDKLKILNASLKDHYREQFKNLYKDHLFDDVTAVLQWQRVNLEALREEIRQHERIYKYSAGEFGYRKRSEKICQLARHLAVY